MRIAHEAEVLILRLPPEKLHSTAGPPCRDAFQLYIAQDAHFLAAFSAAYQSALRKATEARDSDAEKVLDNLLQGALKELELHAAYATVRFSHSANARASQP
jgi:thiaminase